MTSAAQKWLGSCAFAALISVVNAQGAPPQSRSIQSVPNRGGYGSAIPNRGGGGLSYRGGRSIPGRSSFPTRRGNPPADVPNRSGYGLPNRGGLQYRPNYGSQYSNRSGYGLPNRGGLALPSRPRAYSNRLGMGYPSGGLNLPYNSGPRNMASSNPYGGGYRSPYGSYNPYGEYRASYESYRPNYTDYNAYGNNAYGNNAYGNDYREPRRNVVYSGGRITIICPTVYDAPVHYRLNTWDYTIQPGQSQRFTEDRAWTINFDRGGGFGSAEYELKAGTYRFQPTSGGWQLYRIS